MWPVANITGGASFVKRNVKCVSKYHLKLYIYRHAAETCWPTHYILQTSVFGTDAGKKKKSHHNHFNMFFN